MGFGLFSVKALRGMNWQLYVPHFAQIVCTMTFRTRKFALTHAITIVMQTFCRLLHEFHNLRGQDDVWGTQAAAFPIFPQPGLSQVVQFMLSRIQADSVPLALSSNH